MSGENPLKGRSTGSLENLANVLSDEARELILRTRRASDEEHARRSLDEENGDVPVKGYVDATLAQERFKRVVESLVQTQTEIDRRKKNLASSKESNIDDL